MIVNNQKKLELFKKYFNKKNCLCVDTEFERKKTYYSKLSIITISDGQKIFIFDLLKFPDQIKTIREIFKSKKKIKIIHGGMQDIEIFLNHNVNIEPFFDTQIASGFLGLDKNISYANLVKKYFKKILDKKHQNEDWLKRPLLNSQIKYLERDVKYLKKMYLIQSKLLKKEKKLNFAKEEFSLILKKIKNNNGINSKFKKKLGIQLYNNKNFINLIKIRDDLSKKKNLPKNWILKDEEIITIIKNKSFHTIKKNKIFSQNQIKDITNLLKKLSKIRVKKENNDIQIKSLEFFRFLVSKKYSIDQNLIASKFDIAEYKSIKKNSKWRNKIFYDLYEKIITGKKKFHIKDFKPFH